MNEQIKEINIKNCKYYLFNEMINMKYFDLNRIKVDEKSYKNIITVKKLSYVNINNVNPLYFIIDKRGEYIEESNRNKQLMLVSTDINKEISKKYTRLWDEIKASGDN